MNYDERLEKWYKDLDSAFSKREVEMIKGVIDLVTDKQKDDIVRISEGIKCKLCDSEVKEGIAIKSFFICNGCYYAIKEFGY